MNDCVGTDNGVCYQYLAGRKLCPEDECFIAVMLVEEVIKDNDEG